MPYLPHLPRVLRDLAAERHRQEAKFPDQHLPDIYVGPVGSLVDPVLRAATLAASYRMPSEEQARRSYEQAVSLGVVSWFDVLVEEVSECLRPAIDGDVDALRAELVQVAAVAARWIEDIDERKRVLHAAPKS